ncbi:capsule biosynthesis GfcC D2 domain-containing protein [Erwinia sp. HR93]|uniref:capsule biosynthesis GfcC D2 domain-containing protein n=1 Tax=Erwinia sp. HR93 TaxID=3094840 RepID=UPI002ADEDFC9|nr:capsule biosynthesis GfcC D2 domain-containing protein [Erwinia sp. HR93]MEA1063203.1 capsule biosynthesis GfcC D2 domain-containing protein [Erwinia sp. HR93]
MRTILTCFSLLLALSGISYGAGDVTVHLAGGAAPLKLSGVERLADLVTQPALAQSWWPGAVIAEPNASAVAQRRHRALLQRLAALASENPGETGAAFEQLRRQLADMRITGRLRVNLDPDWVRVHAENNLPLDGHYTLWAGAQPASVTLLGLTSAPGKKVWVPGRSVDAYLDGISRLRGAERSYAWVIYPDGRTLKAPIAYWNHRHIEPTPGSLIFIGFADALFSSARDGLNEQILYSLTHRIPD